MSYWTEGNGRRIGALGFGLSGRAAARLLHSSGFSVIGLDSNKEVECCEWCSELFRGEIDPELMKSLDGLVLSPGVSPSSELPSIASSLGLPMIGEIELASHFTNAKVLAVTGSNGKTTTVEWLGYLLRETGRNAVVAGNVGFPFSLAVLEYPDAGFFVLEVSSYQLETVVTFRPSAAAILNLTPDHLDRHGTMEDYGKAKAGIFMNQHSEDALVLNAEDPGLMLLRGLSRGVEMLFSRIERVRHGADSVTGSITLCTDGQRIPFMACSAISLPGRHNLSNALAVVCMAASAGIEPAEMVSGLKGFPGVPHRIELIGVIDGVDYVNDSKSTNVDSLRVALESFTRPVVLLAGGKAKESDYSVLRSLLKEKARAIVLFGDAADELSLAWDDTVPTRTSGTLSEAVGFALDLARAGDVILLSPGCASFDQYSNFEERGDHFREIVRSLSG